MLLDILSFFATLSKDKPLWVDFLQMAIPVGLAIWGFVRAYRAWERQKKREITLHFDQKRYDAKLEACKGIWPLLAYMSAWENEKAVFVKRKDKYFFRKKQGEDYLKELAEAFFEKGYGVFIPGIVRDKLYHFRGIVYKLLESASHENPSVEEIEVKNPKLVEAIPQLFQEINSSLREMLLDSKIEFGE